ncbi:MAG: efflux RND transporter periplasmic adaptor subunit [Pseudomonadota bacterium]
MTGERAAAVRSAAASAAAAATVAVVVAAGLLQTGCEPSAASTTGKALSPLVRAHTVTVTPSPPVQLRATIAAASRVRLGFKLGGVVAALSVERGDRVARGQVVGRLSSVDTAAVLRAAEVARDKARRDLLRSEQLVTASAIPATVRDDARSQLDVAEAQLSQAREAFERAVLVSPVSGTVVARLAEPGETVGPGMPVVVIDSSDRLVARTGVNERERVELTLGVQAALLLDDGTTLPGEIATIATTPSLEDGLYTVEVSVSSGGAGATRSDSRRSVKPARPVEVSSTAGLLLPGMLVRLRIDTGRGGAAIRIPIEALVHRRDKDHVLVIEDAPAAVAASPVVREQPIEVERVDGIELVVRGGLAPGQRIVAEGATFLRDGDDVRVSK